MSQYSINPMKTFHVVFGPHRNPETDTIEDPCGDYFVSEHDAQTVRFALEQVLEKNAPGSSWAIDVEEVVPLGLCDFIIDVAQGF